MEDKYDRKDIERHWHLDKRVPLALILALVLQTGGAVWWAANQDNRLSNAEEKLKTYQEDRERMLKLEIYQENILQELKGIRADLSAILTDGRGSSNGNN